MSGFATHRYSGMHRFSKGFPCILCQRTKGCLYDPDGGTVVCLGVSEGSISHRANPVFGTEYTHRVDPGRLKGHDGVQVEGGGAGRAGRVSGEAGDYLEGDELHRAALAFLRIFKLDPKGREHLRNVRGLQPKHIAVQRCGSLPRSQRDRRTLAARFAQEVGEEVARRFPGVYRDQRGWNVAAGGGVLLPARDEDEKIVGIMNRPWKGGAKYHWLSSSRHGNGTFSPRVHVSAVKYSEHVYQESVILTEGVLKADVIASFDPKRVVGSPGLDHARALRTIMQMKGVREVMLAWDQQWRDNVAVAHAIVESARELQRAGYEVGVIVWDGKLAKGLDDAFFGGVHQEWLREESAASYLEAVEARRDHLREQERLKAGGKAKEAAPGSPPDDLPFIPHSNRVDMRFWLHFEGVTEHAKKTLYWGSYCGAFSVATECRVDGPKGMKIVPSERFKVCRHCRKARLNAYWHYIQEHWPDELACCYFPDKGGPDAKRRLRNRIKRGMNRFLGGGAPHRFVLAVDHMLVITTKEGAARLAFASGQLGGGAVVRGSKWKVFWHHFVKSWSSVGESITQRICDRDPSVVWDPWLAEQYATSTANRSGQEVLHLPSHKEICDEAKRRMREENQDPDHCDTPGCGLRLVSKLISQRTGRIIKAKLGRPWPDREALQIGIESGHDDGHVPVGEPPG